VSKEETVATTADRPGDSYGSTDGDRAQRATDPPAETIEEAADDAADPEVEPARTVGEETTVVTGRWTVGLTLGMVAGAAGLLASSPALFLSGIVGFAYAAYGYATRPPSTEVLVERSLSDPSPVPGERIEVTVTVENVDSRSIPDLRVVDDPPIGLPVVEGSPAFVTGLNPGATASYSYVLKGRRGTHEFGPTTVVTRNVSGETERRRRLENGRSLTCRGRLEELPLDSLTVPYTGRVETDSGGEGIEFHSTRQYTHGDPMSRIDWNRYARTNELTTTVYRKTEAATVVVMVDDRARYRVVRRPGEADSLQLCRHAGRLVVDTLLDSNNRVGVAMFGDGAYLTQGGGRPQAVRARRLLEEGPDAFRDDDKHVQMAYGGERVRTMRRYFPENSQVVFVTPLLDDKPVRIARRLQGHGHEVTVVSPDTTSTDSPGETVSRIERTERVRSLRETSVRVVDWSPDDPLDVAVQRVRERWSR